MKYIKHFSNLSGQTEYLNSADIDTYLGYVDENDTVYYDDAIPIHDYSKDYLTIESLEDSNDIFIKANSTSITRTISASTDNGETWNAYTTMAGQGRYFGTLNAGDKLLLKGENSAYGISTSWGNNILSNKQIKVYGNVMSLIYGDNFVGQTALTADYAFTSLFWKSTGLTDASNLILPSTTLRNGCYSMMFRECNSLTTAPVLPATTLANNCYNNLFFGCSNLNSITCLATNISATQCTNDWVYGVGSTGTFVKNAAMTRWTTGTSGIPSGWTVQNA